MLRKIWGLMQKEYYIREIVLLIFIILSFMFFGIYTSLAIFEQTAQKNNVVNLVSGDIELLYVSSDEDYNTQTNQITVAPETTKYFDITIHHLLPIDVKYKMYYKPVVPTSFTSDITVGMSIISQGKQEDILTTVEKSKTVRVAIENNSLEVITVEIGAQGGYGYNDISLMSGTYAMTTKIQEEIPVFSYEYQQNDTYETFLVPQTGDYLLELWGAQGGKGYGTEDEQALGGTGGYMRGMIHLQESDELYIYVGGKGGDATSTSPGTGGRNGGVSARNHDTRNSGGSGGASDIRVNGHTLYHRIIVAGGGGAGSATSNPSIASTVIGGAGGGFTGIRGQYFMIDNDYTLADGLGGTESSGGTVGSYNETMLQLPTEGTFGIGGFGALSSNWSSAPGGGGWYGGGGANHLGGGGGGSSYILTATSHKPSGYNMNSKYFMTNDITISGNELIPNTDGHGFVIITYYLLLPQ